MKDRKYVEDAYNKLQTQKLFDWAETQVNTVETPISKEEFIKMNEAHQHQHPEKHIAWYRTHLILHIRCRPGN